MIEGTATRLSFAREVSLLGARSSVYNIPGKTRFAASKSIKTKFGRIDPFRRTEEISHLHTSYQIELAGELDCNTFVYTFLAMLFTEFDGEVINGLFERVNYLLRGDNDGSYCAFWIKLEDGTNWRVSGAAIVDFQLNVNSRGLLSYNASFNALKLEERDTGDFVEPDFTFNNHSPLSASNCKLYSTDESTWPNDAGLGAKEVLTFAVKFNWRTEYEPAQYGLDGLATKYRKSFSQASGSIICESGFQGTLLETTKEMKHLLIIPHVRSNQSIRIYFDKTLSSINAQDMLARGSIVNQIDFEAKVDESTGLSRIAIVKFRDDPPDIALPFDFAVIRYKWNSGGGTDLDTRTAVIGSGESIDGNDVGWSRGNSVSLGGSEVLTWGGDNTGSFGPEAVLVDFKKISEELPSLTSITIRLRSNWYSTRVSGDHTIEFETYLGGTMNQDGFDFINSGGILQQTFEVNRNAASNVAGDVDGSPQGTLVYEVSTQTANILDP